jgi:hypothetical protein
LRSSPPNLSIIGEVQGPHLGAILVVQDEGIMNFPHEELIGNKSLDQVKKVAPSLVPLVKGKIELPCIGERLR